MKMGLNAVAAFIWRQGGAIVLTTAVVALMLAQMPAASAQGPASVADLAEQLTPSVVNISTRQNVKRRSGRPGPQGPGNRRPEGRQFPEFFDDLFRNRPPGQRPRRRRVNSLGSGFVIDPSGIIITNNHVIDGADQIDINFHDGSKLSAKVLGRDPKTDIAVLKVESDKPLKAVPIGNSDEIRVGDWVMAIGNPFGLGGSVTLGIVSARNRNINSGPYDDYIQTDAAINRGNSGGPLFNMAGEVVGINTAIYSPSGGSIGIGFSVPTSTAAGVISQLRNFGETRRGWLGVRIQPVTEEMSKALGLDSTRGAHVADITPTGPAEQAGLLPRDVIISFDGKPVLKMRDLPRIVAETAVGTNVEVVVIRKGERQTISVKLGRLEDGEKLISAQSQVPSGPAELKSVLGMKLAPLSKELREQFKIEEDATGVVITEVTPESAAAKKLLAPGDVIVEAGEQRIKIPADVSSRVDQLKSEGRKVILLWVLKGAGKGDARYIALPLGKG